MSLAGPLSPDPFPQHNIRYESKRHEHRRNTIVLSLAEPWIQKMEMAHLHQDVPSQIKLLEVALSNIPPGDAFMTSRQAIETQMRELKRSITRPRPEGAQLDSRKAALACAAKRREECNEACKVAAEAMSLADSEYEKITKELAVLEVKLPI